MIAAGVLSANHQVHAATTYTWNNTGNAWETPGDWSPTGPPTSTDIASFDPTVANAAGVIFNPTINAADAAQALNLNNNYLGGAYSFSGTGTLTLGTGGIVTRGFGTQTISGPILAGAATGNLTFNIGTDSGLTLAGATTALTNAGAVNLNGGTLTLDNTVNNTAKLGTSSVPSFVGGTLSFLGNSAGTAYTLGAASFNGGFNTVSLGGNGATSVNFNNSTAGTGFSLRTQTFMVEQFVSTTGVRWEAPPVALVTFSTGRPLPGANGLLASSSGGGTVGFATVRDTTGDELRGVRHAHHDRRRHDRRHRGGHADPDDRRRARRSRRTPPPTASSTINGRDVRYGNRHGDQRFAAHHGRRPRAVDPVLSARTI